jgi:quinol monooxygenase YgiN
MYGLIVKLMATAGKRDEVVRLLTESAGDMPGCLSYVVAADSGDGDAIWVTEVWDSAASHDASLSLPSVKSAIPQVKPLISSFSKIAATTPVWGVGFSSRRRI